MRRIRNILCYSIFVCFLFSVLLVSFFDSGFVYGAEVRGVTDTTIKLGGIYDQTGMTAGQGVQLGEAFRTYFEYINSEGGMNGRKIKTILEDDRYTIPTTIAVFKKLVFKDEILAIVGPTSTQGMNAIVRQVENNKMLILPVTSAEIVAGKLRRYVFHIQPRYRDMMYILVDHLVKNMKKGERIAGLYADHEFGKSELSYLRERIKFHGIELVTEEVLNFMALEATTQILSLKKAKADYVVTCGQGTQNAIVLMREARKMVYSPKFYGNYATCEEDTVKGAGEAARNFVAINAFGTWYDDTPGTIKKREIYRKLKPDIKERSPVHNAVWVKCTILAEGIKRAGRNLNNESLVDALESIRDFDTKGLCGLLTFSPKSHVGLDSAKLYKSDVEKGRLIPMTEWVKVAR